MWNEGPGFSSADKAKLFRRFSRIKRDDGSRRGSGLGLYNSWRIIQLHHGRIRANASPGEWAEFTVELPQPLPQAESRPGAPAEPDALMTASVPAPLPLHSARVENLRPGA